MTENEEYKAMVKCVHCGRKYNANELDKKKIYPVYQYDEKYKINHYYCPKCSYYKVSDPRFICEEEDEEEIYKDIHKRRKKLYEAGKG